MTYIIQRVTGRGYALTQSANRALRIGRGTNADLRSENPAVALEHAVIEPEASGYLITDRGSVTGTYVNRKPVETARLAKGDIIEIGDLRIDVQMIEPGRPLFLRVMQTTVRAAAAVEEEEEEDSTLTPALPGKGVVRAKKYDYAAAYRLARPWLTKLSLTALALVLALGVIGEMIRPERQKAFMPGGLSSAHARAQVNGITVADNCSACHTPFKSVTNAKCIRCHQTPPHAVNELNPPDCFECHAEHRGAAKLAATADARCTGCHADLTAHVRGPVRASLAKIPFFGEGHPDFVTPPDTDTLRFNHKLHLAKGGVFNGSGRRETLECKDCHGVARATPPAGGEPVALNFESHCQRCHRLTFDARLPDAEVPHGDPNNAYGYIALLYAGNRDLVGKPPDVVRRILATRKGVALDARAQINGEQVIKTKCAKCHDITQNKGLIVAAAPVIVRDWLTGGRFAHARHANVDCEQCHDGARNSSRTADILMPGRDDCTTCHSRNAGRAASTCKTCHEYHAGQRLVMASLATGELGREGRMFQSIGLAVIVVLLLVVLIPVGIALFMRLRPERSAPPRAAAAPPPPLPTGPTSKMAAVRADLPTDKVSKSKPAVPPPAPPPPAPAIDETQLEKPLPAAKPGEVPGTQMVEWYGLLKCTSGPLDGQRFTIEDEGFYIGRDPALSQVVIADSKISKRHVRIVPRDGKVWAIDQDSTNGTYLAGSPTRITEVQLKRGDTLILGDNTATFVYQI
ncbi:MAG TPA: FHA domain-containing protein [Thermoanaerobaculia bacterium]|nr:FHA domain-containing protein [Thermoanaerobaculia bacterium]